MEDWARVSRGVFLALLLALQLSACSGREAGWTGTMYDSGGVTIVSNTGIGLWASGEEWTFQEELRIGLREGPPEYLFGQVTSVAVDSQGRIYVLDMQALEIRVYSPSGVFERTMGNRGSGPGELTGAQSLLMIGGDTLLVPDRGNLRFNRYAPDGSNVGSTRMDLTGGDPFWFKVTPSGMAATQVRQRTPRVGSSQEGSMEAIILLASDGATMDTLLTFPPGQTVSPSGEMRYYAPEPYWDLTDNLDLVFAVTDNYRIGVYSQGRLERVIVKAYEPKPVGPMDRDVIRRAWERRWIRGGGSPEVAKTMAGQIQFEDVFPAFGTISVGPQGTLWVQHVQTPSDLSVAELASWGGIGGWQVRDWDVFDSRGRFLGVVEMPQGFFPMLFRGEKVYGVLQDKLNVEYVVRLRIVGDLSVGSS
jgi:hypothetical protein